MSTLFDNRLQLIERFKTASNRGDSNILSDKVFQLVPRRIAPRIPVSNSKKNDYSGTLMLHTSPSGVIYHCGPPGCGKSTFGLHLLWNDPERTFLCVQPNPLNMGNQEIDFNQIMPAINNSLNKRFGDIPQAACVDLKEHGDTPFIARINLTTIKDFADFLRKHNAIPMVTTLILDEFHLISADMVLAKTILTALESKVEILLSSATPPGVAYKAGIPPGVKLQTAVKYTPQLPPWRESEFVKSLWNPVPLFAYGEVILYPMPTDSTASKLADLLSTFEEVEHVTCLLSSSPKNMMHEVKTARHRKHCVIITPMIEAGITVTDVAVCVDTGLTNTVVMEKGVIFEKERFLTRDEDTQRTGRNGRDGDTIVFKPTNYPYYSQAAAAEFFQAGANIIVMAAGSTYDAVIEKTKVAEALISTATREACKSAVKDTKFQVLTALHRYDDSGAVYPELLPGATNIDLSKSAFVKKMLPLLRIFTYQHNTKYFIGVVVDLTTDDPDLDQFIADRSFSFELNEEILRTSGVALTTRELTDCFEKDHSIYIEDMADAIINNADLTDRSYICKAADGSPQLAVYSTIFTDPEVLMILDAINRHYPITSQWEDSSQVTFFCYFETPSGKRCVLALPHVFTGTSRHYDMTLSLAIYKKITARIVAIAGVINHTDRVTSLDDYAAYINREHTWFKQNMPYL